MSETKAKELTREEKNIRNLARVQKKVQKKQTRDAELKKEAKADISKAVAVAKAAPPKQPPKKRGLFAKIGDGVGKAWNWFKDGGWTDVLSVGATLLADDSHLAYQLGDASVIPMGTILYSGYISPESFKDTNLYTKASLFTYYEFFNTFISVEGLTGSDHASGALGIFINPDPSQDIHTSDPKAIVSMVSNFNGAICRLDKTTRILVPTPEDPLHVNGNDQLDLRLTKQGQLYIIAYTDIDTTTVSANVKLNYNCDFAKDSNPVFRPMQQNFLAAKVLGLPVPFTPVGTEMCWFEPSVTTETGHWSLGSAPLILPPGTFSISWSFNGAMKNLNTVNGGFFRLESVCQLMDINTSTLVVNASSYTNMRGMGPNEQTGIPTTTGVDIFTTRSVTKLRMGLRLVECGDSYGKIQLLENAWRAVVIPLVLYEVKQNDSVNSVALTRYHRTLPEELKFRKQVPQIADTKKVINLEDQLQKEIEDEIRISQSIRQRRLSGLIS